MQRTLTFKEVMAFRRQKEREARAKARASAPAASTEDIGVSEYSVKHAGRGRWNVVSRDGSVINDDPMTKDEARELAAQVNGDGNADD